MAGKALPVAATAHSAHMPTLTAPSLAVPCCLPTLLQAGRYKGRCDELQQALQVRLMCDQSAALCSVGHVPVCQRPLHIWPPAAQAHGQRRTDSMQQATSTGKGVL